MTGPITMVFGEEEIRVVRRLNAKINGSLGGKSKSRNKTKAARRNVKVATRARLAA